MDRLWLCFLNLGIVSINTFKIYSFTLYNLSAGIMRMDIKVKDIKEYIMQIG